jgi:hypothetical protein
MYGMGGLIRTQHVRMYVSYVFTYTHSMFTQTFENMCLAQRWQQGCFLPRSSLPTAHPVSVLEKK